MARTYDFYRTDRDTGARLPHPEAYDEPYFGLPEGWEAMDRAELDRWAIQEANRRRGSARRSQRSALCEVAGCKLAHEHNVHAAPKGEWEPSTPPFIDTGMGSAPGFKPRGGSPSTYHDYMTAAETVTWVDGEPVWEQPPVTVDDYPGSWDRPAVEQEVRPSRLETERATARRGLEERRMDWMVHVFADELDSTEV